MSFMSSTAPKRQVDLPGRLPAEKGRLCAYACSRRAAFSVTAVIHSVFSPVHE